MNNTIEISKIEILNDSNLPIVKKRSKKTQIFLYDTQRPVDKFIMKLKYRNNGKYDDIPHFIVTKTGEILNVFDTKFSSKTFGDPNVDKKFIKIAIENLGWLNKNTITGIMNNWINDVYRIDPFIKKWRDHYYWDRYKDDQIESVVELCKQLCDEHAIPYLTVPSQGYIENLSKFKGIVCKSNFQTIYTDINPSFNFRLFYKDGKTDTK
jgi:hypothetical protein